MKFIGIGVGPGDPELVTLKAVKTLETLDYLVSPYANIGSPGEAFKVVEDYLSPTCKVLSRHFIMTSIPQKREENLKPIADEIVNLVNKNKKVGFVTLGDPMTYSTYIHLLEYIDDRVPIQTIPGITSFSAIAAQTGMPLVVGDSDLLIHSCRSKVKDPISVLLQADEEVENLEEVIVSNDCVVLMKAGKFLSEIKSILLKHNLLECAVVASDLGKATEEIGNFDIENPSYFTTVIINKMQRKNRE